MFFHVRRPKASFSRPRVPCVRVVFRGQKCIAVVAQCLLEKELILYPRSFGPNLKELLTEKLIAKAGPHIPTQDAPRPHIQWICITERAQWCDVQVEGSCSGRHGFIITVTEVLSIGKGKIREGARRLQICGVVWRRLGRLTPCAAAGAGLVTFPIKYMAVVFRPFKGEVLDAVVTTVNKMGFFAEVGPLQVRRPLNPSPPPAAAGAPG